MTRPHALLQATFHAFSSSLLAGILPRLVLLAFTFAQPFLVTATISYVENQGVHSRPAIGKALIGAFALVYTGIAVSLTTLPGELTSSELRADTRCRLGCYRSLYATSVSFHPARSRGSGCSHLPPHHRLQIPADRRRAHRHDIDGDRRGTDRVRPAGHPRALGLDPQYCSRHLAAGAPTIRCLRCSPHPCSRCVSELMSWDLFNLISDIAGFLASAWVASRSNTGQRRWIEKVQARLHTTAALLQNMKTIKMLGLTGVVGRFVESLRRDEIDTSKGFRKLVIWQIFLCMLPSRIWCT
jgi:ATP-binding cassette subfamily C (CFTR/MRP) protein 1